MQIQFNDKNSLIQWLKKEGYNERISREEQYKYRLTNSNEVYKKETKRMIKFALVHERYNTKMEEVFVLEFQTKKKSGLSNRNDEEIQKKRRPIKVNQWNNQYDEYRYITFKLRGVDSYKFFATKPYTRDGELSDVGWFIGELSTGKGLYRTFEDMSLYKAKKEAIKIYEEIGEDEFDRIIKKLKKVN